MGFHLLLMSSTDSPQASLGRGGMPVGLRLMQLAHLVLHAELALAELAVELEDGARWGEGGGRSQACLCVRRSERGARSPRRPS